MEIKLKSKKIVKIKDLTIADEAKLKDILLRMVKPESEGIQLVDPNYNCLLILQTALEDPTDDNIKTLTDNDRIEVALKVQEILFAGNEKPSK